MMRRPHVLSAAALVLALSLTACGGDDDEGSDGGSGGASSDITKAEFVEQGNAICAAGNEELRVAAEPIDSSDQAAIEAYATDVLVPNIRGQLDDLRDLGFPEADADVLESTLAEADAVLDDVEADPSLITSTDDPFSEVNDTLTEYGLVECGS